MGSHRVVKTADLPVGKRQIVYLEGRSIGVFNVNGTYCAIRNSCPHQGAPLCLGTVTGMTLPSLPTHPGEYLYGREGEILRCPWHGWEFDLTNGKSIYDPNKCLVKSYEVTVEPEESPGIETFPVTLEKGWVVVHI
ncbi:MAG: Rieske [2Fe-2S] iron-sulfur protein [Bacilli bacterium]|nr:Rieske [2Fe-2S] iron-sulfur protein [Bacilli bacterium]